MHCTVKLDMISLEYVDLLPLVTFQEIFKILKMGQSIRVRTFGSVWR